MESYSALIVHNKPVCVTISVVLLTKNDNTFSLSLYLI